MKLKIFTVLTIAVFVSSVMAIGSAEAFDQISAQNAYDMVVTKDVGVVTTDLGGPKLKEVEPALIDIRTLAECSWVGSPADENGNPIAVNFPYKLWTHRIDCETRKPILRTVKHLFGFLIRRTFPDKDTPLMLMCRSGKRSDEAAKYLETTLGYNNVYEIDIQGENGGPGRGGFQGSSKSSPSGFGGYRGWPGRCDPSDSVSWMDTGLPITQKLDCSKIWPYMWRR
ncbi:MAG: hypothetical protein LWX51_10965 [Deltaproteobacteria bacterium]|jgi:rhodanese-related sulfurtransferase|nr:hypothetical protein [Deltaproteobacteria bacterium]